MRIRALLLATALSACAGLPSPTGGAATTLTPADAATTLAAGGPITMTVQTPRGGGGGEDPLILMSLRSADGRAMSFEENNHAPAHVMAQAPGGALAEIMGLPADAAPKLYGARAADNHGAPFICGPDGPAAIGYYAAADGAVTIFGLKQEIEFDTRPDGSMAPAPFSPDQICARLRFSNR